MKTAVVISPYRASAQRTLVEHEAHAKLLCARLARAGWAVYAGHLSCPQFLDEYDANDRKIGIETNKAWIERSDRICIWDPWGISSGMTAEIGHAEKIVAERREMYLTERVIFPTIDIHYFTKGEVPEWADLHSLR